MCVGLNLHHLMLYYVNSVLNVNYRSRNAAFCTIDLTVTERSPERVKFDLTKGKKNYVTTL